MAKPTITLNSITDAVALAPWLLRFQPEDSFVVVGAGTMTARIDHPHSNDDLIEAAMTLGSAYRDHPGTVILLAFTDEYGHALDTVTAVTAMLDGICDVRDAAMIDGDTVTRIPSGEQFTITPAQRDTVAAAMVAAGHAPPRPHRDVLRDELTNGSTEPVDEQIADALQRLLQVCGDKESAATEVAWVKSKVRRFLAEEVAFSDTDAARFLVAINGHKEFRDAALALVTTETARTLAALWRDLVRRAPEQVRTEAAVVLALVSWVSGDGGPAWVALEVANASRDHVLATLVTHALETPLPPTAWDEQVADFAD